MKYHQPLKSEQATCTVSASAISSSSCITRGKIEEDRGTLQTVIRTLRGCKAPPSSLLTRDFLPLLFLVPRSISIPFFFFVLTLQKAEDCGTHCAIVRSRIKGPYHCDKLKRKTSRLCFILFLLPWQQSSADAVSNYAETPETLDNPHVTNLLLYTIGCCTVTNLNNLLPTILFSFRSRSFPQFP